MIGVSGVRGVVGHGLTPDVAARFASAMGSFCRGGRVIVGRDTRPSGEMLRHAVISGLLATGCEVIDLGVCPTPTVQLAVRERGSAGIIITASHNPGEYNGLKFVSTTGIFLTAEEGAELRAIFDADRFAYIGHQPPGDVSMDGEAAKRHVSMVLGLSVLDVPRIQARKFKVVLDPGNGTGVVVALPVLEALGCEVVLVNAEPTGIFSRGPEPIPENLGDLCKRVVSEGADVGFAIDPDGDRLSIVTEQGVAIGEEFSMVLGADLVLSRAGGGVVVTNLSTSRMVDRVAERWGGHVSRTPVGEVHVSLEMMAKDAVFGGEGNGGVILPEAHLGRDASVGLALVLELLADRRCSVSEARASLPHYTMIKTKARVDRGLGDRLLEVLAPLVEGGRIEKSDGVKISWDDGWLHVRSSNTEPIVRVVAEAEHRSRAEALVEEALHLLSQGKT